MKLMIYISAIILLFSGCSKTPEIVSKQMPQTYLLESSFDELPSWKDENYQVALDSFTNSCRSKKTRKIYNNLCQRAKTTQDAKEFLETAFTPYEIFTKEGEESGLLTGYYEPELQGSLAKTELYKYPLYATPKDLIIVDLSSIYPKLKNYRLRGKLEGNRVVPYAKRGEKAVSKSDIICYVDSKIDLFFLEIQGSGRVTLESGETLFIGYANQNGHKYRAIGRYLVSINAMKIEDVSLQSIRAWLEENPSRVDEVLNYNESLVYFQKREKAASGSLGLELRPLRSIAVDRSYIPLGSMVYLSSKIDEKEIATIVQAQDTGGAIKGAIRADMFLGFGVNAMSSAGKLKSPLKLWILLPAKGKENI